MDKLTELEQKKAELIEELQGIGEKAEERSLNDDERQRSKELESEISDLDERISTIKKTREREKEIVTREVERENEQTENNTEYKDAFEGFLRRGRTSLDRTETRALEEGADSEGGYLVPVSFENQLTEALEERNKMRQLATVSTTASEKRIPIADDTGQAAWIEEEGSFGSSDPSFSQKTVDAYKVGTMIKVSEELLHDNTYDLEGYIQYRFVRRIGDKEEAAFINGTGSQPTGFLQDAEVGKTASATDAVTADELIDLYHSLPEPYRSNATWIMNDATAKAIRKLKDDDGQYIWRRGLRSGRPDVLLGRPVVTASDMPDMTTGNKAIAFGDFGFYEIFDRQGIVMQRLNELYAETGQVGYKAYRRTDGLLRISEAVQALQMG